MNAFLHHLAFEFRSGLRHKQLLLMNYLFPLGFFILMGSIMTGIDPTFREKMIPAMVLFAALAATLMGIPIALTTSCEKGIFRTFKINGVPAVSILSITAIKSTLHLLIASAIITASAPILFKATLPESWSAFILTLLLTAASCATLSTLIGVVSPNTQVSILLAQFIFVTSILLGGLMFPHQMLPDVAQKAALLLPATHAMNLFNTMAMGIGGGFSPGGSVVVLSAGSILAFVFSIYLFRWDQYSRTHWGRSLTSVVFALPYLASVFLLSNG